MFCGGFFNRIAAESFKVVASHLDNPRGITFGTDGSIYVAEAGRGGNGSCTPFEMFGDRMCFGTSGAITRISDGTQQRIVTALSSFAHPDGGYAFGPNDIAFQADGSGYVAIGGCLGQSQPGGCGSIIRLQTNGRWKTFADLDAYERSHSGQLNNFGQSNPFALLAFPKKLLVANAAGNDLLRVTLNGEISKAAVFPQRDVKDPSTPGLLIPMDAVPSSVAVGPDGAYYVSELTGSPFPIGAARIYRFLPGKKPQIYATGFTNVIDMAFEREGSLLVLEIARKSLRSNDTTGALIRLKPNGSRQIVMSKGLKMPTAVAIGNDNAIYISNCGACAGNGQVLRISAH